MFNRNGSLVWWFDTYCLFGCQLQHGNVKINADGKEAATHSGSDQTESDVGACGTHQGCERGHQADEGCGRGQLADDGCGRGHLADEPGEPKGLDVKALGKQRKKDSQSHKGDEMETDNMRSILNDVFKIEMASAKVRTS